MSAPAFAHPVVTVGRASNGATPLRVVVAILALAPALSDLFMERTGDLAVAPRVLGNLIWITSLLPAWAYLGQSPDRRKPIPFIPIVGLAYGLCFGLQAALGQSNVFFRIQGQQLPRLDPTRDYDFGLFLSLGGWLVLLLSHWAFSRREPETSVAPSRPQAESLTRSRAWAFGMVAANLSIEPLRQIDLPFVFYGILIFASLIGYYGIGLLSVFYARGQLNSVQRLLFYLSLATLVTVRLATGQAGGLTYLIAAVAIGFWIGKPRVSWRAIVIGAVLAMVVVTLRGLVVQYRAVVWFGGGEYSLFQRLGTLADIAAERRRSDGLTWMITAGGRMVAARSAYVDMFADVIRQTPNPIPYWNGHTYVPLITSFIPRVLWPSKPLADVGRQFGRRYSYVSQTDESTAINLPYLIEFYMNFGAIGVIFGMAIVGLTYARLESVVNRRGQSVDRSMAGLALLLPLFNIESDFRVTFGALVLNAAAIWVVYRWMTRPRAPGAERPALTELGARV